MQTKLTLRLPSEIIVSAKKSARLQGKSLSQLVADYFIAMSKDGVKPNKIAPPITQSLIGVLGPDTLDGHDYKQHLKDKYL